MRPLFLLIFAILCSYINCKTKEEWKSRSIYQILTDRFARSHDTGKCNLNNYCGGDYKGIIKELDYIKGMGFDAIWISPIIKNAEYCYSGYSLINLYELNPHFGTEEDFKEFISACHKKDIWVLLDVIVNHVANVGEYYSQIIPFNSSEYYHDECTVLDWDNQWQVENCQLGGPDLKHENDFVSETLLEWIKDTVKKYDIDGIRVDTAMGVPKWFLSKIQETAGVFQIGDIFSGKVDYVSDYQNHLDSVFNYPLFYIIESSFVGSFRNLEAYWWNSRPKYPDPETLATFLENHDNKRFLNRCNDKAKYTNAVVFSILWEGIPVFYYGGEQYYSGGDDPQNREPLWDNYNTETELYKILGKVNSLRKQIQIWEYDTVLRYVDDNFFSFTRGNVLACFTNTNSLQRTITYHDFSEGDTLCNILDDKDCVSVSDGNINIEMGNYPKVYVKK